MISGIKGNLAIIGVVTAALASGYAIITKLHYDKLKAQYEKVQIQNANLLGVNGLQSETIQRLTNQRRIDDELIELLVMQTKSIDVNSENVTRTLKELVENDDEIKDLFDTELPADVVQLLNNQIRIR